MTPPTITYLTDIWFGRGIVRELPEIAAKLNVNRPLVVTDRGLSRSGMIERIALPEAVLFDGVESNLGESSVGAGVAAYRELGCDGVPAVGGGEPLVFAT